jgi:uncharacterized protein (DUF488 family)
VIYTIGHSTRSSAEFIGLLETHGVTQLADVRKLPLSRRHPHFSRDALAAALSKHGIAYRHYPDLGGLRRPDPRSVNTGLRNESFRGYADYMLTDTFERALLDLLQFSEAGPTAVMCAEAVWWRCHRKLLSDILLVRGVQVRHILSTATPKPHELSEFARPTSGKVTYPGLL